MKVSCKARYAVEAALELAGVGSAYLPVAEIARRRDIPQTFLEQLLLKMKRCGLTESRRGPDGGYTLAKDADRIRLGDIYVAVEGPVSLCGDGSAASGVWRDLEGVVLDYLNGVTLGELSERENTEAPAAPSHSYTFAI